MIEDHRELVRDAVLDADGFIRLTLDRRLREDATPWVKIVVRPVVVKGRRRVQFSYFDGKRDITRNYSDAELPGRLDEVLAMPFGRIHAQTASGDIHVTITRSGRATVTRTAAREERTPDLSHDRAKKHALDVSDEFLRAIGITDEHGQVRPSMRAKFRQVNEFLRIIEQTVSELAKEGHPLRIVDCGCGNAHLTFSAHHYLSHSCGLNVETTGIDTNEELIGKCKALRDSLGWAGLDFRVTSIADFEPENPPDMLLSLHACDTATDEAIAKGIVWESKVILAAPCCQHELHHQLRAPLFRPITRHGVLNERLADILTDTFRALALRIMGYRTSVIEFVSPEHTSKNLMIRAEKGLKAGDRAIVREYEELKRYWDVTPCIEEFVGESFLRVLGRAL